MTVSFKPILAKIFPENVLRMSNGHPHMVLNTTSTDIPYQRLFLALNNFIKLYNNFVSSKLSRLNLLQFMRKSIYRISNVSLVCFIVIVIAKKFYVSFSEQLKVKNIIIKKIQHSKSTIEALQQRTTLFQSL